MVAILTAAGTLHMVQCSEEDDWPEAQIEAAEAVEASDHGSAVNTLGDINDEPQLPATEVQMDSEVHQPGRIRSAGGCLCPAASALMAWRAGIVAAVCADAAMSSINWGPLTLIGSPILAIVERCNLKASKAGRAGTADGCLDLQPQFRWSWANDGQSIDCRCRTLQ